MNAFPAVVCQQISKSFGNLAVVQGVNIRLATGRILALLGPSGCGKTTLLRLLAGFESLDSGYIEINNQRVADERMHVPPERRRVGIVFQDYAIFPHLSVAQNVAFGLKRGAAAERVSDLLRLVGLQNMGDRMPHQLSGGQQQRVALARALAPAPAVLLMDEPFSNLDAALRVEMRQEVRALLKQTGTTAVFVTHDQEEALFMGDEVAVMRGGRIEQVGTPETVFHRPRTRFVAEFLGHTDFVTGQVQGRQLLTPLGVLPQPVPLPAGSLVEIVVRPDDVRLTAAADGNGRIASRQFLGIAYLYQIQLDDGALVHSWQPHTVDVAEGMRVRVWLDPDETFTCFRDGQAVFQPD
ncbi:MAG: ABC transporter ATP-binding protein [Candidatus Promineifilaceae bacterium]